MATTTNSVAGVQMIALGEIRHDQNVRQELLAEEVDALAQSIALLGQLTPVSVLLSATTYAGASRPAGSTPPACGALTGAVGSGIGPPVGGPPPKEARDDDLCSEPQP